MPAVLPPGFMPGMLPPNMPFQIMGPQGGQIPGMGMFPMMGGMQTPGLNLPNQQNK